MQETPGINSKELKVKEDYRYKQKEAELQLSLMNLILTVAIFLMAFAGNIVLTSLNVSLNTTIWAVVLLIGVFLFYVGLKGYFYCHGFILDSQERILSENFTNIEKVKIEKEDSDTDKRCPLSSNEWIVFLNGEIGNLENEGRNLNNIFPVMALFTTLIAVIISSVFSAANSSIIPQNIKADMIYTFSYVIDVLKIVFIIIVLLYIYSLKKYLLAKRKADKLKNIRNNIIYGCLNDLNDTNEVRKKWELVMQSKR